LIWCFPVCHLYWVNVPCLILCFHVFHLYCVKVSCLIWCFPVCHLYWVNVSCFILCFHVFIWIVSMFHDWFGVFWYVIYIYLQGFQVGMAFYVMFQLAEGKFEYSKMGKLITLNRNRKDNTIAQIKRTKGQTTIY
jgi:hypothetical protein